jgi:hypothetical protein
MELDKPSTKSRIFASELTNTDSASPSKVEHCLTLSIQQYFFVIHHKIAPTVSQKLRELVSRKLMSSLLTHNPLDPSSSQ